MNSYSKEDAAAGYEVCRRIAHKHGANFSVGFRFLPKKKRDAVYAAYAYCRLADDIADDPGDHIARRLDEWQHELERCYEQRPTQPVTIALADALEHFAIPKSAFVALIDGCRQDMVKRRYENFDELLHYCDLVATSISDISLAIFGYKSERAPEYGRNLSTALQLTNIIRDVGDDLQRDRIYLPLDELARFGVSEAEVIERNPSDRMQRLMAYQIERAESYFRAAQPLLAELDFDSRFPVLLMGAIYSRVLAKLKRDPLRPLESRLRLPLPEKIGVVLHALVRPRFV